MPQTAKLRVAIVFGGQSAEHEISILSAQNVLAALDRERFEPVLIGIDRRGRWLLQDPSRLLASGCDPRRVRLEQGEPVARDVILAAATADAPGSIDVIFPMLHGTMGEDGTIQGLFELAGIPYVGAGVLGSAVGMDKDVSKRLLREAGIPIVDFLTLRRQRFELDPARELARLVGLGLPVFTKPANAGSSIGVRKVTEPGEIEAAVRHAFQFDEKVLVEAAVSAREIELAVLAGQPPSVSVAGEVVVRHSDGFYSYEAKYLDESGARLELPARLDTEELMRAQALAARAFEVLECEGLARVDLFFKPDGTFLVNEINTLPGFTAISMYPKLWALSGLAPSELVTRLIELALERGRRRAALERGALR